MANVDVPYLQEAMDEAGFKNGSQFAEAAGVSPPTVYRALKKGSVRESTATKFLKALGPGHSLGPVAPTYNEVEGKGNDGPPSLINLPTVEVEDCVERFEGKDCPTSAATCRACWDTLGEIYDSLDLPFNLAVCRTKHGWKTVKGHMLYMDVNGRLLSEEEVYMKYESDEEYDPEEFEM